MPKKMIYTYPYPDGAEPDRRIEVGWSRHPQGSVQVGSTRKAAPGVSEHDMYLNESNSAPGVTWTKSGDISSLSDTGELRRAWEGEHVELDREQINQLIRALREARDQAFGRDE